MLLEGPAAYKGPPLLLISTIRIEKVDFLVISLAGAEWLVKVRGFHDEKQVFGHSHGIILGDLFEFCQVHEANVA